MGSSTVGLDCGLLESSVKEADSPLVLGRAPEVRFPRAWAAPSDRFERPPVAERSFVDDWGEIRFARDRTLFIELSSRLVFDRYIMSSELNCGSDSGTIDGDVVWLLRKGRKMDSSINSWMRFTAESSVSGAGGMVTSRYARRRSRTSLERLISRGEPGKMYAINRRCQSIHRC